MSGTGPGAVVALVGDLMDRSRVAAAAPGVRFARGPEECAGAATVVVDLAGRGAAAGDLVGAVRSVAPDARIVCFGPHVDEAGAAAAHAAGADVVVPRSRFFRDPGVFVL